MVTIDEILKITTEKPYLSSGQIGILLGCKPSRVRSIWRRNGIFRGKPRGRKSESERPLPNFVRVPRAKYERLLAAERELLSLGWDRRELNIEKWKELIEAAR